MEFEPIWNAVIAWYLFLAGLGGGAFVASTLLRIKVPGAVSMRKAGHVIAPIVVAVGLVLLMVDAKAGFLNPLRFALLLTNFGSVMTWGVVFLGAFMVVALVVLIMDLAKKESPLWLDVVGAALGVCVAVYTGCLLGVCAGFPLWNNALLPVLFLVSAMSTGFASVLAAGLVKWPDEVEEAHLLKTVLFGLGLVEVLLVCALLFITSFNSTAGFASVANLMNGEYAVAFWLGFVIIGLAGPLAVEAWVLFSRSGKGSSEGNGRWLALASEGGVLVGGFMLRLLIILAAVPITLVIPYL